MKYDGALTVLEEVALGIKDAALDIDASSDFDRGRLTAYYEVLSSIVSQCDMAGIDLKEIGLAGFVPESILRTAKKAA